MKVLKMTLDYPLEYFSQDGRVEKLQLPRIFHASVVLNPLGTCKVVIRKIKPLQPAQHAKLAWYGTCSCERTHQKQIV